MTRRSFRIVLEIFAGLIAGLALLIGIGVWRLSQGPVSLGFLTPAVQEALEQVDSPFDIEISDTVLTWGGWDRAIDIIIRDVTLRRPGEAPALILPNVSMSLSIKALGRGVIAPTDLDVYSPEVVVRRYRDGSFTFGLLGEGFSAGAAQSTGGDDPNEGTIDLAILDALIAPPEPGTALSYLNTVSILNAEVTLDDRFSGLTWRMPDANIVLARDDAELRGNISATLKTGDTETGISAVLLRDFATPDLSFSLSFDSFQPSLIARAVPQAAILRTVDEPLSGSLSLELGLDGAPREVDLSLVGDFGRAGLELGFSEDGSALAADVELFDVDTLSLQEFSPEFGFLAPLDARIDGVATLAATLDGDIQLAQFEITSQSGTIDLSDLDLPAAGFQDLRIAGQVSDGLETLELDELSLTLLDRVRVSATGAAYLTDGAYVGALGAEVTDLPFDGVEALWPPAIGTDARVWLFDNLTRGRITRATVDLTARAPASDLLALEIDDIGGAITLRDADIHYFRPLPPIEGADADITYGKDWFRIIGRDGTLADTIRIPTATMDIDNVGTIDDTRIAVDFETPVTDALAVLDQEPLELIRKLGLQPDDARGSATGRLELYFPIEKALTPDRIVYAARAQFTDFALLDGPFGTRLDDGSFTLSLDRTGMDIDGEANSDDGLVSVKWRENFQETAPVQAEYELSGVLSERRRAELGYVTAPYLTGPVGLGLRYRLRRSGDADLSAQADLTDAVIDAEPLGWRKEAGDPAASSLVLQIPANRAPVLDLATLRTADLDAAFGVVFAEDFEDIAEIRIDRLIYDKGDAKGVVRKSESGDWSVLLEGDRIDIAHLIEDDDAPPQATPDAEADPGPTIEISAQYGEVIAGATRRLENVAFDIRLEDDLIRSLALQARLTEEADLRMRIEPDGEGQTLSVESDDGGAALKALDWSDRIEGGRLSVTASRATVDEPYVGSIEMDEFRLTRAPALARIMEFISVTGAVSALAGPGMDFIRLEGDVALEDGRVDIDSARAYGVSVGITAEGFVDTDQDVIDLKGTVVPAYTFNRILGAIPIIGFIVTGGEGEGVFAADYSVEGPIEDPEVSVNPLTALAPGLLRQVFRLGDYADPVEDTQDDFDGPSWEREER